jgi:hypothetical protein
LAVFGTALLGVLAAVAVMQSALPESLRWLLALTLLVFALWRAWRESRRRHWLLHWPGLDRSAIQLIDGREIPITLCAVQLRGPLAGVSLNDGSRRITHVLWWPDTLDAASRRALRLMAQSLARIPASPGL